MSQIGVDICQLPEFENYKQVVVTVDYFSKWSEAEPLKHKTGNSVANFLYKIVSHHRCFSIHFNNQGRKFENSVNLSYRLTPKDEYSARMLSRHNV